MRKNNYIIFLSFAILLFLIGYSINNDVVYVENEENESQLANKSKESKDLKKVQDEDNITDKRVEESMSKEKIKPKEDKGFVQAPKKTIIVRTPENFVKKSSAKEHMQRFSEYGVKRIILLVKNDEDLLHMDSGEVFYKSSLAPIATDYETFDFDALRYVIDYAQEKDIEVYAWLPQFHDKALFEKNPELGMKTLDGKDVVFYDEHGEYFVNPISEQVQDYQLSIIEEVIKGYDIDGLYIDWVRFDDYDMDLSDTTVDIFKRENGYDPKEIDFNSDNKRRREWNSFREDSIASYIKDVSKLVREYDENITLGAFILPVEMKEVGQNPLKFEEYLDEIGVMLYDKDWGYPKEWIYDKAIVDIKNMLDDDNKIVPVLDTFNCHDKELIDKVLEKNVSSPYCFEYWDWSEKKLNY